MGTGWLALVGTPRSRVSTDGAIRGLAEDIKTSAILSKAVRYGDAGDPATADLAESTRLPKPSPRNSCTNRLYLKHECT